MSAKPQPMAGQTDAADDLIAELSKLMAQDSKGDRPAEPQSPSFSLRIPGGEGAASDVPAPAPRFDFERTVALVGERPAVAPSPVPPRPAAPAAPPSSPFEAAEPFSFDFGFDAPKAEAPAPVPTAAAPAPSPVVAAPKPAPAPVEPALASVTTAPADHDSIADLIAAELTAEMKPAAEAATAAAPQIAPEPEPPAAPVVVAAAPRATPQKAGSGWAPTAIAANLGGQDKPARAPLRALNLQPAPKSDQDRFNIPPVFGVGTRPAPVEPTVSPVVATPIAPAAATPAAPVEPGFAPRRPAPSVAAPVPPPAAEPTDDSLGRDPIDEIESLIGRAMRVEFDQPVEPAEPVVAERPAPSPALRSLASQAEPVAAPVAAPQRALSGADEAILAAAQATGAEIGWVDTPESNLPEDETPVARPRRSRAFGMTRALAGPLVAVTLLLAAGFGLYWVLGLGGESGPAPLLTADTTPTKETPVVQPDAAAAQQSVVFNEIDGVVPGAEEQLVSRDQTDVNEVTQVPPTADISEEGLANRKVRTVTVRPDGTIVSGDDSVAGSAILPVDRPNVPAVPGAETATPELLAAVQPPDTATATAAPAVEPVATAAPVATPEPATPAVTPVTPGSTVAAVDLQGNALAGKTAPVPMVRPAGLVQSTAPTAAATSPVNAIVQPAASGGNFLPPPPTNSALGTPTAAQPAAAAQPVVNQPVAAAAPAAVEVDAIPNSAAAYAQLASLRTEEEARAAAQNLVTRFGPLFGGANMEVQRVDLGARGIYYRVRVPANSTAEAGNICTNVIAAGGDCVPM